ncbi:hypothetical protein CEXT_427951 [Caerostris extrusa]|uniref:Uncharacterized protein n=1 Tax=Caerostris extrusa TaxID=172846 RepID=A0AAV4Y2E4_CAEEX|nr:hypothetical protein CEXT_427951 [Caerostris extrusa]
MGRNPIIYRGNFNCAWRNPQLKRNSFHLPLSNPVAMEMLSQNGGISWQKYVNFPLDFRWRRACNEFDISLVVWSPFVIFPKSALQLVK